MSVPSAARPQVTRVLRDVRVLAVLSAVVIAAAVAIVLGGGGGGGAAEAPPATGAAALVPADALAYVHVSLDSGRPAVKRALVLAQRFPDFPLLQAALLNRLGSLAAANPTAGAVDYASDIRPWLGHEAGVALLNTSTTTSGSIIVLEVSDRARARTFLARFGSSRSTPYRSTTISAYAGGTEAAFVGRYLVLGQDAGVRAAVDAAGGRAPSLRDDSAYRRAVAGEPGGRVLDLYASAAGVRRLLAPQGGITGALGALLYQPALDGVSIAVTPRVDGVAVRVHSALDARLVKVGRAPSGAPTLFSPTLPSSIPAGTILTLDLTNLDRVAPRLLSTGAAGGIGAGVLALLRRLGSTLQARGVNVQHDIVSAFHGETVVAIAPRTGAAGGPALLVVTRAPDEQRIRAAMAAIQVPLAQLFPPPAHGPGRAAVFTDRQVAGITAHQLALTPGLELDYAVFDHKLVIATSLGAIAGVRSDPHPLAGDPAYRATLSDRPSRLTSLLFLNFTQLLSLGEQTGLTSNATYKALRPDLQKIRAVGLSSTSGEADSTAELFLQIP